MVSAPNPIATSVRHAELAVLVNSRGAHHQPTVAEAEEFYYKKRLQSIKEQQVMSQALGNEKRALMQEKYKEQIEKRRKEKEEEKRRKLDQAIAGGDVTVGLMGGEEEERTTVTTASTPTDEARKTSSDTVDATKTLTERPVEVGSDPKVPFTITIPGASDPALHTWYKPMHDHTPKYTTMADAHRVGLFTALDLTGNAMHRARVEVFKDLWLKGYFMGGGLKFGADFLVYPGEFDSEKRCMAIVGNSRGNATDQRADITPRNSPATPGPSLSLLRRSTPIPLSLQYDRPGHADGRHQSPRHRSLGTSGDRRQEESPHGLLRRSCGGGQVPKLGVVWVRMKGFLATDSLHAHEHASFGCGMLL